MDVEEANNPLAPISDPILPQYPELILAAIDAIGGEKGVNKSRISKQIEASHGNLPVAHKTLLSHHLNKMRASGQLLVFQNNYFKFDPNSPPRRGRGRPRKPKEPGVFSPKPRGRPRKSLDGAILVKSGPSLSGRKRGRPRKSLDGTVVSLTPKTSTGEKRGRGRPPKVNTDDGSTLPLSTGGEKGRRLLVKVKTTGNLTPATSTGEKRGRGRPKKVKRGASAAALLAPATSSGDKRGRGRPRKVVITEALVWVPARQRYDEKKVFLGQNPQICQPCITMPIENQASVRQCKPFLTLHVRATFGMTVSSEKMSTVHASAGASAEKR
ncbi:uncharacterized protein LOC143614318 [Bidens hawaiensis]|uniref:uncharacterized protein LOC143614318 n=1 Tax=Bidens hawaiensis TaxID=980011 RepID=UPI00404A9968